MWNIGHSTNHGLANGIYILERLAHLSLKLYSAQALSPEHWPSDDSRSQNAQE